MKKVTSSRFRTYGLIGLISFITVVGTSSCALTQLADDANTQLSSSSSSALIWPTQGFISQGFDTFHEGIDISGPPGTPVVAAAAGEVIEAGWDDWGLGNAIELQHPDGSHTVYGHNRRLLVSKGEQVNQGQVIAEMGSSGNSTGPHLHFEVQPDGDLPVDPIPRLPSLVAGEIPPLQARTDTPEPVTSNPSISNPIDRNQNFGGIGRVPNQNQLPLTREYAQGGQRQAIDEANTTASNTQPPLDFNAYPGGERMPDQPLPVLPPVVARGMPALPPTPVTPKPFSTSDPVRANSGCSGTALIEGDTAHFRVKVCQENGRLFYLGQSLQEPSTVVRLPAWSVGENLYRADQGSYSYYVSPEQVEVLQNGRQISSERFLPF